MLTALIEALPTLARFCRWLVPAPRPRCILIVEDTFWDAKNLSMLLARCGCEFDVAESAEEGMALIHARKSAYYAAIVDMRLPGMSGYELKKRIRVEAPKTRIIFATAYPEIRLEPGDGWTALGKPVSLEALEDALR